MGPTDDLRLLLRGLADGAVDPNLLAVVAGDWAGDGPGLIPFLVARGVLRDDDLRRLAGGTGPPAGSAGPSNTATFAGSLGETGTYRGGDETPEQTPPADPGRPPGAPDLPPGGRYRVLGFHDRGGLGEVWRAEDRLVGRVVALKVLRPDRPAGPDARDRFVREARITGRLEHPSVVPVYDLSDGPADPFYVMRFVAGRTLADAVKDYHARRAAGSAAPLDLTALLDACVAVCRAVAFAHARGVLHRDLKGQNVILGDFGEVFLLDWGLGKSSGPAAGETPPADGGGDVATATGAVVGTPAYMAPEVADHDPATPASDIYGLGAVLYAVLTGKAPYSGSSAEEVLDRVRRTDPPPVREANPAAPAALAAVCRKAMARDPAARYASAEEVATEVRRWLADEPVAAYREPVLARAGRWARRHRTLVASAAAVLVAGLAASAVGAGLVARAERETARERDAAARERDRAATNFALAWEVSAGLGELAEATETGRTSTPVRDDRRRDRLDRLEAAATAFAAARPDDPDLWDRLTRVLWFNANLRRFLNDIGAAEAAYREAARLQRGLIDRFPADARRHQLGRVLRDHAGLQYRVGRLSAAAAAADEAAGLLDRSDDPGARLQYALTLLTRAEIDLLRGRPADAGTAADQARAALDGLAAAPPHPYTPLFRAEARSVRATARREAAGGDPAGLAAARADHDAAIGQFRALLANDRRRDFLFIYHGALVRRAETARRVPGGLPAAAADLDEAVAGLERLTLEYPDAPLYPEELGRALTVRGAVRAAAARAAGPVPDLPGLARAEADLYRAVGLLELLAGRFPGLHEPRGLLGDAWAALVPLADDRAAVGTLLGVPGDPWAGVGAAAVNRENLLTRVQKAAASYRKAAARCRECPHYPRRAEELRRDWPAAAEWVEGQRQARMADRE